MGDDVERMKTKGRSGIRVLWMRRHLCEFKRAKTKKMLDTCRCKRRLALQLDQIVRTRVEILRGLVEIPHQNLELP